jgi:hypothetical protein
MNILNMLIERLESTKQIENISEDFTKAIDFSTKLIKHVMPVIEAEVELAKQKGYNEGLKEAMIRLGIKE